MISFRPSAPLLTLTLLAAIPAASAEEGLPVAELKRDTAVDFAAEIVPFLRKNCLACHNQKKAKADLNMESPKAMLVGGDGGPALVPGKPMESLVFLSAAHLEEEVMPPTKNKSNAVNLSPDELALLKLWIEQGGKGTAASVLAGPTEWESLEGVHASYAVTVSDNSRFAAAGNGNRLHVYDLRTGELDGELVDPAGSPGTAHRDLVHSLAFNRHGILASGGYRSVKLWERSIAPGMIVKHKLPEAATVLTTSPDGTWIAAGDSKGNLVTRPLSAPEDSPTSKVHNAALRALLYSADGKQLFSASDDKTVARVNQEDAAKSPRITLPSEALSLALLEKDTKLVAGCADGVIRVLPVSHFDLPAEELAKAPAPAEWKAPSKVIALEGLGEGGMQLLSASEDGSLRIWDLAGKEVRQITHGGPLNAIAVHPPSNQIATAGADGVIRLWNAPDGKMLRELKGDLDFEQRRTRSTQQRDLAKRLAELRKKQVGENEKQWNDLKTKSRDDAGKVAAAQKDLTAKEETATGKRQSAREAQALVTALEAAKDPALGAAQGTAKKATEEATKAGNELVTARRNLRNAQRTRDLAVKDGTRAAQRFLATQAASAEADAVLATTEEVVKALEGKAAQVGAGAVKALAFSPDGTSLAVSAEKVGLRLWNATGGLPLDVLHRSPPSSLAYGADGQLLAALPDKKLLSWKKTAQWSLARQIGDQSKEDPFPDRVLSLAFHPRGHLLAAGSGIPSRDGSLSFWRVSDGTREGVIEKAHLDTITGLAFSPDGHRIASSSTDRYLKIHDVETLKLEDQLEGHTNHVLDVAWSADGETLASAGADRVAKLWAVSSSKQKKTEEGFKKELTTVAFVGTGETILTGGGDKILKVAGQNLSGIDDFVYDAAVSPDGSIIVAGGARGILRVWQASDRKLLYSFRSPRAPTETAAK
ncbi:MAG: hypothetical protein GY872_02610 [Roseibacillus sp.]|nr:hypothetical protein [Roseibacillus sp.]HJM63166.1 c-type cytochrome domain-containing protein [Roseibacillus sp.]